MSSKPESLINQMESTSSFSMESKHDKMKKVVAAIQEYLQTKAEDTAITINRYLQGLSVTIDLSVFDPHTNIAAEFFVSLYELMNKMEPRSHIAWYCVDVLTNACKNPAARRALISTYHFMPSLSRLLGDQLTIEKKIRLLRLLQDLSCGIKISWQIPHLPHLLLTLTKWVESGDEEIVTLSLGVLVNICYKNLPAVYTLSRNVDIKKFLRLCLPLQGPIIEVHTCKLLIIFDYMNGSYPKSSLLKLVTATFNSLMEAYKAKDAILLRQIVEFFIDVRKQRNEVDVFNCYNDYDTKVKNLLAIVEPATSGETTHCEAMYVDQDPECMSLILEFLHCLIEQKLPPLIELYPRFIQLALRWIQTDIVSSQALSILRTISINTDKTNNSILEPLITGLPVFLLALNAHSEENIPTHTEYNNRLGALLQLLRAMLQVDVVRNKVLEELQEDMLYKIFVPLLGDNQSPRSRANDVDTCSIPAVNLYLYAMALVNEMAKYKSSWINIQSNLMQNKQIHMILAQALYNSPHGIKKIVLEMATNPSFPTKEVSEVMGTLQSMVLTETTTSAKSPEKGFNEMNFPVLSVAQIERLDETLNKLKVIISEKNLMNISTSDVMELYEYKLASMGHAERAAMASVEAASERCTHLQHRTAQLTAELSRLHQLLFHTQQCHEQAVKVKDDFLETNKSISNQLEAEKGRYKACNSQLKIKEKELMECEASLEECNRKLTEMTNVKLQLEDQNNQLKQVLNKLSDNCTRLEKNVQKKDEIIKKAEGNIENLKAQVKDLEGTLRQKEADLQTKSGEIREITKELMARKQIIDTITKVANSQFL